MRSDSVSGWIVLELSCLVGHWVALMVKNPPASAGDTRDMGLTSGSGRFPERGHTSIPIFLPGESHGQGSLADYSSWGCK